jgi:hypothetical protein
MFQSDRRVSLTRGERLTHAILTAVVVVAIVWLGWRWIDMGGWRTDAVAWWGLTLFGGLWLASQVARWLVIPGMCEPDDATEPVDGRIAVVTGFVPGAEPLAVLEQALEALCALDVPHDTWVLDEGDDPEARALCATYGAYHFSRHRAPALQNADGRFAASSKYGNYNAWLAIEGLDRYDFVANFDVDHVPAPGYLRATLGYFRDPGVGYVQLPQAYYNQQESVIACGAAQESAEFYSIVQRLNHRTGHPTVIGCHTLHRMSALEHAGGFAMHDADDLMLTLAYRKLGIRGVYLPRIMARGLAPADWSAYLNQQRRWARSVLDLKLRRQWAYLTNDSPLARLFATLHGILFLQPMMMALLGIGLLCWCLLVPAARSAIRVPWTPVFVLMTTFAVAHAFRQRFMLQDAAVIPWRAWLLRFAKWPVLLQATIDVLTNRRFRYALTPKQRVAASANPLLTAHLPGMLLVLAAWLLAIVTRGALVTPVTLLAALFLVVTALVIRSGNPAHEYEVRESVATADLVPHVGRLP